MFKKGFISKYYPNCDNQSIYLDTAAVITTENILKIFVNFYNKSQS